MINSTLRSSSRQKRDFPILLTVVSVMLTVLLFGCSPQSSSTQLSTADGIYPVDPIFEDFYTDLGGSEYLGPAISQVFERGGSQCQYTINSLMCFNPKATGLSRYQLAPLGLELEIQDAPRSIPGINSPRIVDGYSIYPEFIEAYDTLFGALHVGAPLTNPIYNEDQDRIEQYFENLGFYKNSSDPDGKVYLLEYGAYLCDQDCRFSVGSFIIEDINPGDDPESLFGLGVEYLGGTQIFGEPLSNLYLASDGNYEQVYENVVFFAEQENPGNVQLRELPGILGFQRMEPGPKKFDLKDNMIFYTTDGAQGLGFHVPVVFDDFIMHHGGTKVSGAPMSDPVLYEGNSIPRQCFENLCLDYYREAAEGQKVKIAPLGSRYLELYPVNENMSPEVVQDIQETTPEVTPQPILPQNISFIMNESSAVITNQDVQTFQVMVFDGVSKAPLAGIQPELRLTLPLDGSELTFIFDATNENGMTNLSIAPLTDIKITDLVDYQVCVSTADTLECVSDTFMVLGE